MKRTSTVVFLILILFLSFAVLPISAPDPIRHWVDLELENLWGFRGEQINLTAYSSRDVQIEIYNPSRDLIYNQSWAGNESRILPIDPAAPIGEYEIRGVIPDAPAYIWFNVVDDENFSPTSFPYLKIHNDAEFWVFANRTFRTDYAGKSFGFTLPDLPDAVAINCFNNSDIFVVRFTSEVVNVDVSLVFIHAGAKMIVNGTMQGGFNSFRFPFFSPQQIQNWFSGIRIRTPNRIGCEPTPLYFDWGDFERAGEHISYDPETHILTVFDVPESFFLDPIIGNNEIEADAESYPNYDEGNRFQVLDGTGNITSFSIYCRVTSGSHDIGVAIYNDSATEPDHLQWNSSRTISHTVARWENFTVSPQVTVANASYVHLLHNKEASVVVYQNDTEGEADPNSVFDYRTYGMPFLDPFPAHTNHAYMFSIYADYTLADGETTINQYSTVNQTSTVNHANAWSFSRFSAINLVASVSSFAAWSLSRFSYIELVASVNSANAWSFNLYSGVSLMFGVTSWFASGVYEYLYGSISQTSSIVSSSGWSFSLFHSIAQVLAVNSVAIFSQPLHNFYGSIGQVLGIVGFSDLTPSVYATRGFVLATIILAFIVVGIPLALVIAKK